MRSTTERKPGTAPAAALLLRAAFLQGDRGIDAWNEWRSHADLSSHVDRDAYRLFPQLYRNLQTMGIEEPLLGKFKGIYRNTWFKNQLLIDRVIPLLAQFYRADTRAILVGEAAMLLINGSDYGYYPIDDFNILVDKDEPKAALNQLDACGWKLISALSLPLDGLHENSIFEDEDRNRIRINWCWLPEYGGTNLDEDIWRGASLAIKYGMQIRIQNVSDQVLSACAHGLRAQETSFYTRAADTMTLLNIFGGEIDWDRLLAQAQKRRLTLAVSSVVRYLHRNLDAPVPQSVLIQLDGKKFSIYERMEQRLTTNSESPFYRMSSLWFRYRRLVDYNHLFRSLRNFPSYLQHRWQLKHAWQVPIHAVALVFSARQQQV